MLLIDFFLNIFFWRRGIVKKIIILFMLEDVLEFFFVIY